MDMLIQLLPLVIVVAGFAVMFWFMNRHYSGPTGPIIVRCQNGHLFTTIWIPFVSLKAVRLGMVRIQHCPVGGHLAFVTPVPEADLSDSERHEAAARRDTDLP